MSLTYQRCFLLLKFGTGIATIGLGGGRIEMSEDRIRTIIREKAEEQLIDAAQLCYRMNMPLRCVYLGLGRLENKPEGWLAQICAAVANGIDDTEAQLFVCRDDDVFVLSRLVTHKTFLRILGLLPGELAPALDVDRGSASLFELNVDGRAVETLIREKLLAYAHAATRAREIEEETLARTMAERRQHFEQGIEMDMALNAHLIASIVPRRLERVNPCVLFVEDDVFSQRLLSNALRPDFEVQLAGTGQEAITSYIRHAPDIVFLDINLPDMTGIDILKELFSMDRSAFVVMLSGNGNRSNVIKAVQGGAKGFVGKPFTLEKIRHYLNQCSSIVEKSRRREMVHA